MSTPAACTNLNSSYNLLGSTSTIAEQDLTIDQYKTLPLKVKIFVPGER
jgi:hypothetical protein